MDYNKVNELNQHLSALLLLKRQVMRRIAEVKEFLVSESEKTFTGLFEEDPDMLEYDILNMRLTVTSADEKEKRNSPLSINEVHYRNTKRKSN